MSTTLDASPLLAPLLEDCGGASQPAVCGGDGVLSYAELRRAVADTADALRRAGVRPGDRVAVCLPKSTGALTAILGTLAAGAAYVPLNHRLPPAQMRAILANLLPRLLVADGATAAMLAQEPVPGLRIAIPGAAHAVPFGVLHEFPGPAPEIASPPGLAAILYTSGTTGEPKGIMLSDQSMISFADWAADTFHISAADRVTSHAPFHFDLSVFDIFSTLRRHATLHLLDELVVALLRRGAGAAGECRNHRMVLGAHRARAATGTPCVARPGHVAHGIVRRRGLPHAGAARRHGRPAARQVRQPLRPNRDQRLYWYRVPDPPTSDFDSVPIGSSCAHCEVTLCDDDGRPVAAGEAGEICVAGPGVMLGYWRRPDLTAASRVAGRVDSYRTGDLGYRRDDGMLMLMGRRDQQVKVRGHRIELLALEAVLNAHPAVREAVAVATPDAAGGRLIAFLSPRGEAAEAADPRDFIAARLAPYYMPDRFEWLPELPRTANGKADRGALRHQANSLGVR